MYKSNVLWLIVLRQFNEHPTLSMNGFQEKELFLQPLNGTLMVQLDNALEFLRRNLYIKMYPNITPMSWTITPVGRTRLIEIDKAQT